MNPLFPELRDALAAEAEHLARPRRRLRLPLIGGGLLSLLAAGGIATAATGVWSPQLGDERRGTPTASSTGVPQDQLDHLAVLRRDARPEDHGADVREALTLMSPAYRGIRVDAVRRLAPTEGTAGADILIPVRAANGIKDPLCLYTVDLADGGGIGCFSLQQVLDGRAVGIMMKMGQPTAAQRRAGQAAADAAQRAFYARRRAARRAAEPLPKSPAARRRAIQDAYRKADRRSATTPPPMRTSMPGPTEIRYSGIVPDGVARVVRTDASGVHVASVANNLYRLKLPGRVDTRGTTAWQDSTGQTVKTITGP